MSSSRVAYAFASLRGSNFRRLWVSVATAGAGRWALVMALGWLVQVLTHSTFWVGVSVFAQMAPSFVAAPVAGVLADRFDRRRLLALSLFLSAATAGMLAALSFLSSENLTSIIVAAFLFGSASTLQSTTAYALLPNVVLKDQLLNGVALQGAADRGSEWVGPLLASPLLVRFGPGAVFLLGAGFSLWGAWATLRIRPLAYSGAETVPGEGRISLRDGIGYVRSDASLRTLLTMAGLHCGLTMSFLGLLPSLASDTLRSSGGYGSLMSVIGLGAIVGALTLLGVTSHGVRGRLYLLTALLSGVTLAALGLSPTLPIALLAAFGMGVSQTIFMTITVAYIQDLADDRFRGRVSSIYLFLAGGVMSFANWGYGALGTVFAPRLVLVGVGSLFVVVTLGLAAVSPSLRLITQGLPAGIRQPEFRRAAGFKQA